MYQNFFQFTRRAFSSTPDSSLLYVTPTVEATMQALEQILRQGEGIGLLTAPAGVGKTLICKTLRDRLECSCPVCSGTDAEQTKNPSGLAMDCSDSSAGPVPVLLLQPQFPTRSSLLQAILFELKQPYARMTEQELRLELISCGRQLSETHHGIAIIVDEAHLLGEHILEELRGLTNYMFCTDPIFRVVLSGQLALEETLTSRSLEAVNQRLGCHVTLDSLSRQQSVEYIETRVQGCGVSSAEVFTPEAMELIVRAADGLPRCLNQLCDHTCLLASLAGEKPANESHVREALDDLMKLPLHWNALPPVLDPISELKGEQSSCGDCENCDCDETATESVIEISSESNSPEIFDSEQSHVFETSSSIPDSEDVPEEAIEETLNQVESNEVTQSTSVIEIGGELSSEADSSTDDLPEEKQSSVHEAAFELGTSEEETAIEEVEETGSDEHSQCLEIGDFSPVSDETSEPVEENSTECEASVSAEEDVCDQESWEEELHDRYALLDARRLGQLTEVASTEPAFGENTLERQIGQSVLELTAELSSVINDVDGDIVPNPEDVIVTASQSLADCETEPEYDVVEPESEADSEYNRLHNELRKRDQE